MIENPKEKFSYLNGGFDPSSVHKTAVRILGEIGIQVGSKKCLEIFESVGCVVDYNAEIVKVPESVVDKTLSVDRHSHRFYSRDGKSYVVFGENNLLLTSGACQVRIKEYNGSYRNANLTDLVELTKLHDFYDCIDIVHTVVDPADLPVETMRTQMAATVFKNTAKACWFLASQPSVVDKIFEMATAIRGSNENVKEKPFFRIAVAPNSVLGFQKEEAEVLCRCAELGIPADSEHYPIMGLTAPLSISGAMAITVANFLCALVLKNAINPNCPTIFPILAGVVNMKNAEIVTSSPEIWKYYIAGIEMGQFYNLPTSIISSSDAKDVDIQMTFEKTIANFISASAGVNNIFDSTGALDSMNLTSYEGIVIELEFLNAFNHFFKDKLRTNHDNDFDLIRNAIDRDFLFLDSEDTIAHFKDFLWSSELFIKDNFINWQKNTSQNLLELANKKVSDILNTHQINQLPSQVIKEIDAIAELNNNEF